MTFAPPRPSRALMTVLTPVNRLICLHGVPGLRDVPWLNKIPGVRGITDIREFDFPDADAKRFADAVNSTTAAFIAPNHPEFFTDWMIDKEVSARVAPMMASWATHSIVNGMGPLMQRFWLWNNLIAQIPGEGGAAGKTYSVEWSKQGHGVLLHPEGGVGWTADVVQPLFPGAVDLALETSRQLHARNENRRVFVVPIIWKLRFMRDETVKLHEEISLVERKLGLLHVPSPSPAERVRAIYSALLARDEELLGLTANSKSAFGERRTSLIPRMNHMLEVTLRAVNVDREALESEEMRGSLEQKLRALIRYAERWLRSDFGRKHTMRDEIKKLSGIASRQLRFDPTWYPSRTMTQEDVAENVKRIRTDYCFGSWKDTLHRFVPQPVGPRIAHIRVPPPLTIDAQLVDSLGEAERTLARDKLLNELRHRMQSALDHLPAVLGSRSVVEYPNPFRA